MAARQSGKVTLFGAEPTGGVLDYANVNRVTACGGLVLGYPTSRSQRLPGDPVDPAGIAPQVRIPPGVRDEIGWVRDTLERGEARVRR